MTLYIAAPWVHREIACQVADWYAERGFTVIARWLRRHHASTNDPDILAQEAQHDVDDIYNADVFVLLNTARSDGKATELGMALIFGKPTIVVGTREGNVFYHLPKVLMAEKLLDTLPILAALKSPIS